MAFRSSLLPFLSKLPSLKVAKLSQLLQSILSLAPQCGAMVTAAFRYLRPSPGRAEATGLLNLTSNTTIYFLLTIYMKGDLYSEVYIRAERIRSEHMYVQLEELSSTRNLMKHSTAEHRV